MTGFSQDTVRYYEKFGPRAHTAVRKWARRMLTFVESSAAQPEHSPPHGHMGLPQACLPAGSTTVTRQ